MHICFLLRHSPYASTLAREAIDMALAGAAFDQRISLIFLDDGVWQLQSGQQSTGKQRKNIEKSLQALALYDIQDCYVCAQSLQERSLSEDALNLQIKALSPAQIRSIIDSADTVMSF